MYQIETTEPAGAPVGQSGYARADRPRPSNDWLAEVDRPLPAPKTVDMVLAAVGLVAIAPLMLLIALLIWAYDGGPVFFSQRRVGLNGRPFKCLKFRSMVIDADARLEALLRSDPAARWEWSAGHKLREDPRITWVGRFLRKSSLDELPQLINVLRGEMSLVGPRPIVDAEVIRYGRWFRHYCAVRPGITGLWQVSGRSDVDYRRRVALDVLYVRRRSTLTDVKILAKTVPMILLQTGSY